MTAIRIYGLIWLLVLGVTSGFYLLGFINAITFPVFGFAFSTLAAGGFVAVLPAWLNDRYSPKTYPVTRKFDAGSARFQGTKTFAGRGRTTFRSRGRPDVLEIPGSTALQQT